MSDAKFDEVNVKNSPPQVNDSLWTPTWLTGSFLAKHLQKYYQNNAINVTKFDIKPAAAGDNYWSIIYRVQVHFIDCSMNTRKPNTMSLIVKTMIPNGTQHYLNVAVGIFKKEIEFYSQIGPQMNALAKPLEIARIFPAVYGVCELNNVMLLEDLDFSGFQAIPIRTGFNMRETKAVLKKLAAFHAISAVLREHQPDIFQHFKYGLASPPNKIAYTFYTTQYEAVLDQISSWPDFRTYATKLKQFQKRLMTQVYHATEAQPNQFNTLVHSDLWANNVMVKHTTTDGVKALADDAVFIDFQFVYWGSPAIDLYYFLFTSFESDPSAAEIYESLKFYHQHLSEFLLQLNYAGHVPTFEQFKVQFDDKSIYGFLSSCLEKPRLTYEHTEKMDLESTAIGNERTKELKRCMYDTEAVKANLRQMIPFFDSFNVFD